MANVKNMNDVLEQLRLANEKKMLELLVTYNTARALRKKVRAEAATQIDDIPGIVKDAAQKAAVDETMDRWLKLLDGLNKN